MTTKMPSVGDATAVSGTAPQITVNIPPHKLTASIRISRPPGSSENNSADEIKRALEKRGVTYGLDEEAIQKLVSGEIPDGDLIIARGKEPISGRDARLNFHFQTVQKFEPKEDPDGRIDYKDIDFIQTAAKGQLLVDKTPPVPGTAGIDVFGSSVSARTGSDVPLPVGVNSIVSLDGLSLLADRDGSITYANRRVSINEIHTIGGDVCIVTGNIKHNGSLIVKGKVDTGFEVLAGGDVVIEKNVTDAKIVSGGNIMVKGGFQGGRRGLLRAAGNIHCKYVDDQVVTAGGDVFIGGELFNSQVTAVNRVAVSGSKGRIVGGRVMAGVEIRAVCLGSDAGTKTELLVGYDDELMKRYYQARHDLKALDENSERVKEGLYVLYRIQLNRALSSDQEIALKKLEEYKASIPQERQSLADLKASLEQEIQRNRGAHIIAEKNVYPGVILQFGVIYKEIADEMGPSYFELTGDTITWTEFRPGKHDLIQ